VRTCAGPAAGLSSGVSVTGGSLLTELAVVQLITGSAPEGFGVARPLTRDEYLATFVEPMRRLESYETYKPVRLREYVAGVIRGFDPPVTRDQLEIHHVYLNGDQSYYHVLIHYGRRNEFLVIVVDCGRGAVHGHHLLDLSNEYGLVEE
jgi:hypothetical protein